MPGACYSKQDLADYIHDVNRAGGVVSIDIALFRDGGLDRSQLEILKELRPRMAAADMHPPVPPGNLAFRKPARLLSLDGERDLEAKKGTHFAKLGNDGRAETMAVPDGEVAWTYQLNLLESRTVRRVRVTFAEDGFATRFRISLSIDGRTWQPIISVDHHDGQPYTRQFTPTPAQFLRISGLQPDRPDQAGKQMTIAELEVYE